MVCNDINNEGFHIQNTTKPTQQWRHPTIDTIRYIDRYEQKHWHHRR